MPADSHRCGGTHTALWRRPPASKGPLCFWEEAGAGSPPAKHPAAAEDTSTVPRVFIRTLCQR
jgi:hypothetical protein